MRSAAGLRALLVLVVAAAAWAGEPAEVAKSLDAADPGARAAAIESLRKSPERDAVVVGALRDPALRASLGAGALEALADIAGEFELRFANGGLRALVADASAPLPARRAAARALGRTGSVADVSALGDAVPALPDEASKALVAIGGRSAESALRRGGGENPPLEVVAALAVLGDEKGFPQLVAALSGPDRDRAAALLRWATKRDLPAEPAAWQAHLRQRAISERLSDIDNEKAGDAVDEYAAVLRKDPASELAKDLVDILRERSWPVFARCKAALALGLGGVVSAKDTLLWACRSEHKEERENGWVRMYAADALARVGDLSCAPALVAMLNLDEDEDRISARRTGEGDFPPVDPCLVRALLRIGCRGAIDRIIDLLAGEFRTRLHRDCLRALDEVSGRRDFAFRPDASKPERVAAVERIRAWWRDARESVPIAPRADDPGWPAFRKAVDENIQTLGGFKFLYQMRAKNLLIDLAEPALPQIEEALGNANDHIRMGAADVLAAAGLRDATPALASRLTAETNPAVRTRLLAALEVCGRPQPGRPAAAREIADAVRAALADRSLDVRIAAARTLGVVGETVADAPRLVAAGEEKRNDDDAFRFAAAAARLRLAWRSSVPVIVAQLRSEEVALRAEAARALLQSGIDLHGYDADQPAEVREKAIEAILANVPGLAGVPYRERK